MKRRRSKDKDDKSDQFLYKHKVALAFEKCSARPVIDQYIYLQLHLQLHLQLQLTL